MPIDFMLGQQNLAPDVQQRLLQFNFDPGALRPWRCPDTGKTYMTLTEHGVAKSILAANVNASMTKEAWIAFDASIMRAARSRLRAVADIRAAGLVYTIPNGMGKTVLEHQRMTDINDATLSMDGLRFGADDRPEFDSQYLPLPICHKDFSFPLRQIQVSRNGGMPLDTSMGEAAGRKVAEYVEKLTLGKLDTYSFGGGTIYGYTNYASVLEQVLTSPDDTAWTPATLLEEILTMKQTALAAKHYGPFVLNFSTGWDLYLDNDYSTLYPNKTLRMRIAEIDNISSIRTLDYLENFDCVMVEMNTETIRMVVGMEIMTLEWDSVGGLRKNYKVMTIMVPQLRADIDGNTGIVYGVPA